MESGQKTSMNSDRLNLTKCDHCAFNLEIPLFSIATLASLGLSQRETEVLFWVAQDKSNTEISKVLSCSEGTVRKHLENIYKKLDVQTRLGAVMFALEKLGFIKK